MGLPHLHLEAALIRARSAKPARGQATAGPSSHADMQVGALRQRVRQRHVAAAKVERVVDGLVPIVGGMQRPV